MLWEIKMKVGVQIVFRSDDVIQKIERAKELGFEYFQLVCWNTELYTDENASAINEVTERLGMKISSFWAGWSGDKTWNFVEGPVTLGIVPEKYRRTRLEDLKLGSDFAKKIGADKVVTHAGFIPENMTDPNFMPVVEAIREIADHCKKNGQCFLFETGQETPVVLLRVIEVSGCDNLGVNYDTANLILYGKANPVDGLEVIGRYVMDVHAKDGVYPTTGTELGKEKKIGEGRVDFPGVVAKLKELGYEGTLTIEREISGEQQILDIIDAKKYLEELING